jgi:hypothetical protein
MLLHTPAGWPVPGGYVHIGDTERDTLLAHVHGPRTFTLPCRAAAAPMPELPAAQISWAGVSRTWTTWSEAAQVNLTWEDLADRFGTPKDLEPSRPGGAFAFRRGVSRSGRADA